MNFSMIKMPWKRGTIAVAVSAGLLALAPAGLWMLSHADWLQQAVRSRIVRSLEEAAGARVEWGDFSFSLFGRSVVMKNLLLRQQKEEPPLLAMESLRIEFGLDALLGRRFSLRAVELVAPKLRIATEDGSLRFPEPPTAGAPFNLIVGRFEIDRGSIAWNSTRYDLSLSVDNLNLQTRYESDAGRYGASILAAGLLRDGAGDASLASRGQARFYVYRDHVELIEATVTMGKSTLRADGEITMGETPTAEFRYTTRLALDSPLVAAYLPGFSSGSATLQGSVEWRGSSESLAYRGEIEVHDAAGELGPARLERGLASSRFWGGSNELTAAPIRMTALGTEWRGSLTVKHLGATPRFHYAGRFSDYVLGSSSAPPNGSKPALRDSASLPWAGSLSGDVEVEGTPDALEGTASIVADSAEVPAGRIPLKGLAVLRYRSETETVAIERLELATPFSQARLNGALRPGASEILVQAECKTNDDVRALARFMDLPLHDLPLRLAGASTLHGVVRGRWALSRLEDWTFDGRVEARDVQLFDAPFERLTTRISLSASMARFQDGVLEAAGGRALVKLDLPLHGGGIAPNLALSADLRVEDLPAARILKTAGRPAWVSGTVRGALALRGSVEKPSAKAEFTIRAGRAGNLAFDQFSGTMEHTPDRLALQKMVLTNGDARMEADAGFDPQTRQFRVGLRTRNWPLTAFPVTRDRERDLGGRVRFDLTGSGRLGPSSQPFEELRLRGPWEIVELSLAERGLGQLSGAIESIGDEVVLDWQGDVLGGRFEGKAALAPRGPLTGEARFEQISASAVAELVGLPLESLSGHVAGHGAFSNPSLRLDDFQAEGVITSLEAGLSEIPGAERGYEIWNPFPLRWSYAEQRLRLDSMRLLGEGTDIEIDGSIEFDDPGEIDVDVAGAFNLAAVESFRPEINASGGSTMQVHIGGAPGKPIIEGRAQLRNGTLRSEDFPNGLSQINGQVLFDGARARIEEATAATGGGTLRLSGNAEFADGAVRYRVDAEADRVRVRYRDSVSTVLHGKLTLSGIDLRGLLSGEVVIHRAAISPEVDLGLVLAALGEPTPPPSSQALSNLQFNIQVGSVPELDVETSLVRDMESRIDLRVTGTALQPSLLGRVSITGGRAGFQGTIYRINRGDIDFVNPFRIEPNVNFELETRVRGVDVALFLSGPARKMNLSFRSDPPLQFNELVSLIAAGRVPSQDPVFAARQAVEQQHLLQAGASTVLSNALSQPVSSRLRRFFGVSRLRVDPRVGGAESDTSARIATEQQITNDLTLIYSYDLSSAQQQAVRVEWTPNRRWSIVFTRDENGLVGGDFLYKKRLP